MASSPLRVLLCSLRREYPLSGESGARRFFLACAGGGLEGEAGLVDLDAQASPLPRWLQGLLRPFLLFRRLRRETGPLILKVPTLGQLPLARLLTLGHRGRVLVWVEGLCWRRPSGSKLLKLLLHEPLLTLARMALNTALPARLFRPRLREFVVASAAQEAEILALDPGARVHRIPNSLSAPAPLPPVPAQGRLRVGYFGHTYLIKGVRELLGALELLDPQRVVGHFALSGLGSRRLLARVREGGHLLWGPVDPAAFYAGIDLLVLPYWVAWGTNAYPNVLVESLFYGVPVLTTDLPLARELFGGDAALFVEEATPEALARALGGILSGETELPKKEVLQHLFKDKLDPERIGQQWKALLTASKPPPSGN